MKLNKILISVFIGIVIAVTVYFGIKFWLKSQLTKELPGQEISISDVKVFRVAGVDVGPYKVGDLVVAEKVSYETSEPEKDDVVVYEKEVERRAMMGIGQIVGIEGDTNISSFDTVPEGTYVVKKGERFELVDKDKITWRVFKKL